MCWSCICRKNIDIFTTSVYVQKIGGVYMYTFIHINYVLGKIFEGWIQANFSKSTGMLNKEQTIMLSSMTLIVESSVIVSF